MKTSIQYTNLDKAYQYYNKRLFGAQLPGCIITLQRKNSLGYFCAKNFQGKYSNDTTDEIALNPDYFDADENIIMSTLVHEMVHLWQHHFGNPSASGYHNWEWANKMESVGLMPSSTGQPGGEKTGFKMDDYIIEDDKFDVVTTEILKKNIIEWQSPKKSASAKLERKKKNKIKYTCEGCNTNIWGKPGLNVFCGECDLPFLEILSEDL